MKRFTRGAIMFLVAAGTMVTSLGPARATYAHDGGFFGDEGGQESEILEKMTGKLQDKFQDQLQDQLLETVQDLRPTDVIKHLLR